MEDTLFRINNFTYRNSDGMVENINIKIGHQEFHALVSNNRSEQNIFLQAIMDLNSPTLRGEISFNGHNLKRNQIPLHKLGLSILNYNSMLYQNLSIAENLHLTGFPQRKFLPFIHWKKVKEDSRSFLRKFGLEANVLQKVKSLSEENKRMVYIASIFMQNPKLIIMHEPLEGLSESNTTKVFKLLDEFKSNGGSILYITKQWEEALKLSDEISIMTNGKIVDQMSTQTAKKDPQRMLKSLNGYSYTRNNHIDQNTKKVIDAVFKSAELLSSEYELKDVLLLLAKESTMFMNADGCSIKLIDESTWSIIDELEYKQNDFVEAQLKKDVIVEIAKENDIFYVNANDKVFESLFERKTNVKTTICIPVLIHSQVTGFIQFYYEDLYVYSNNESRYLETLARHAAIAIEETRLMGRSALLQESNHRIKNNLQSIIGIISLQRNFVSDNSVQSVNEILDDIIARIKSISSVHNLLSKDKLGRSIINVKEIIEEIISFSSFNPNFKISLDLDDIFIPYNKATSIALVINELVTNCFKHAFKNMDYGTICIKCKKLDTCIFISVKDNGRGLPEGFDPSKQTSLGLSILQGIVTSEFQGEMKFISENGTTIEVKIPSQSFSLNQYRKREKS
ncbi:hypothetical protein GCM10010978_32540 [Compostibacillus humi]|uniref:Uncharacterized protein n=1 Tax=Compostibacillus humi TaxID=1245525 RepID=A0A8J2XJB8_9BACI|nr:histidine kinase dimerization/phosphoacceptor domain -containing protein [Compostibacillus humi]GFZ91458.1 hypothetical protein GCM10010978_32540 [Compostibacillus humi]